LCSGYNINNEKSGIYPISFGGVGVVFGGIVSESEACDKHYLWREVAGDCFLGSSGSVSGLGEKFVAKKIKILILPP